MSILNWLVTYERLSPPALTVRAQAVGAFDTEGQRWRTLFPRTDAASVKLSDLEMPLFRPVADRRPWDGNGRQISFPFGKLTEYEMLPIEAYNMIGEYELQRLMERNGGSADLVRQALGQDVPKRIEAIAQSCYRRVEVDSLTAWGLGTITVRNTEDGTTQVVTLPAPAGAYSTAATAWNNGAVNAYTELVNWLKAGQDQIGPIEGVMIRRATLNEIEKDAPAAVYNLTGGQYTRLSRADIVDAISQDLGSDFRFELNEDTVDAYNAATQAVTRTKTWAAQRVAAIPAGGEVGRTHFAPVLRAQEMALSAGDAGIDVRGATVYPISQNDGKAIKYAGQLNALSVPYQQLLWVIDAGV